MADETTGWDATKIGAAIAALLGAFKFFTRARTANAHDRIRKLERKLEEMHKLVEVLPVDLEAIDARVYRNEVNVQDIQRILRELRSEMRDSLADLERSMKRTRNKLEEG